MSSAYQNLPVWKKQLDLVVYLERIVKNFDRHHKYVIGSELRRKAHEVLVLLAKANVKASGPKHIAEAIEGLEELKILVHVCKEIKAFNKVGNVEYSTKLIVEVLKQCEGWLRSRNPSSGNT